MTQPIVCHENKCKNRMSHLDECLDCDIIEQIEHDLFAEDMKTIYAG